MGLEEIKALDESPCPKCGFPVHTKFNFCPSCGKKLKGEPIKMTVPKQLFIYAISILLPPLGLWPGIKYIRSEDQKVHLVGLFALVLTAFSTIASLWYGFLLIQGFSDSINYRLNQLNELQRLQP